MLNWVRHSSLVMYLKNQYTLGVDAYPKTLMAAYNLAIKWKKDMRSDPNPTYYRKPDKGVNLATDIEKGKKRDLSNVKCFDCNKNSHLARDCKEAKVDKPAEAVNTTTTVPPSGLSVVTNTSGGGTPATASAAGSTAGADQGTGTVRQVQLSTFSLDGD